MVFHKLNGNNKSDQHVLYGPNILTAGHNEWRKHRRIAGPTFTEGNNALVWESTIEIILGYFLKWNRDGKGNIVKVSDFMEVTTQIAFMVFSTAGMLATYPLGMNWTTDSDFRLRYQCGLGLGQERSPEGSYYVFHAGINHFHARNYLSCGASAMAPLSHQAGSTISLWLS